MKMPFIPFENHKYLLNDTVFISSGYHKILPQTEGLKTAELYFL